MTVFDRHYDNLQQQTEDLFASSDVFNSALSLKSESRFNQRNRGDTMTGGETSSPGELVFTNDLYAPSADMSGVTDKAEQKDGSDYTEEQARNFFLHVPEKFKLEIANDKIELQSNDLGALIHALSGVKIEDALSSALSSIKLTEKEKSKVSTDVMRVFAETKGISIADAEKITLHRNEESKIGIPSSISRIARDITVGKEVSFKILPDGKGGVRLTELQGIAVNAGLDRFPIKEIDLTVKDKKLVLSITPSAPERQRGELKKPDDDAGRITQFIYRARQITRAAQDVQDIAVTVMPPITIEIGEVSKQKADRLAQSSAIQKELKSGERAKAIELITGSKLEQRTAKYINGVEAVQKDGSKYGITLNTEIGRFTLEADLKLDTDSLKKKK